MKNKWFAMITDSADPETLVINIMDDIGAGDWQSSGYSAKQFLCELNAYPDAKKLEININSDGGSVFDGFAIYNMIKGDPRPKTGRVMGIAASISSMILLACDVVIIPESSYLMIHNPWSDEDIKDEVFTSIANTMANAYSKGNRKGLTQADCLDIMNKEVWYTGAEALAAGFCDFTEPAVDIAAAIKPERLGRFNTEKAKAIYGKIQESRDMKELEQAKAKITELETQLANATAKAQTDINAKTQELEAKARTEIAAKAIEAKDALDKAVLKASEAEAKAIAAEVKAKADIEAKDAEAKAKIEAKEAELATIKAKLDGLESRVDFKSLETPAKKLEGLDAVAAHYKAQGIKGVKAK